MSRNPRKKKPQKIQPQLIIYPLTRDSEYPWRTSLCEFQKKIKYRLFSRHSDGDQNRFLKRIPSSHISNVKHYLSRPSSSDHGFLKFLKRTRTIRRLVLTSFDYNCTDGIKGPELRLRKLIRRIFVLCSKVQKIHIRLKNYSSYPSFAFPFKCLRFAKSLKHLTCSLDTAKLTDFQYLANYFVCAKRRRLNHTSSFVFYPKEDYSNGRWGHRSPAEAQKIIERIISLSKDPSIKFELGIDTPSMYKKIVAFTEIFPKLQNVKELTIQPKLDYCIPKLLKNFKNPTDLTTLSLQLGPSQSFNQYWYDDDSSDDGSYASAPDDFSREFCYPLDHLVHFISKAKSLTTLKLTLKSVSESRPLNDLMDELKELNELSTFSLILENSAYGRIDSSIFTALIESLESLQKLTDLTLSYSASNFHSKHYSSSGMQGFFKSLKALQNLGSLDFTCEGSSNPASDGDFIVLCKSLKNFKQLEKLRISMPNCKIEDKGVVLLSTFIPKFKKLQSFSLDLRTENDKVVSAKGINQLVGSFLQLQSLSSLSFSVKCSEVSMSSAKLLATDLFTMKNLKSLSMGLTTSNEWNSDVKAYLGEFFEQLRMKFETRLSCSTAKKR